MNLNVFDFDYDLTWFGFFMNADEKVYGRYGGREDANPDRYLTLAGLKHAMRAALDAHRRDPRGGSPAAAKPALTAEQYPAAGRLKTGACIHCHQVNNFRREALREAGKWKLDNVWVFPPPGNLGLSLDPEQGDRVRTVRPGSPADQAGLRAGDRLKSLGETPVASYADAQYALQRAPAAGSLPVQWVREGREQSGTLALPDGWRKSDISWRVSMWGLDPAPGVHGKDLTPAEKKALGLPEDHLAFRQGSFVTKKGREVGIRENDIIIGVDGKTLAMTMLQFNAYVRLNYRLGDRITLNLIRDGKRLDLPMVLTPRAAL